MGWMIALAFVVGIIAGVVIGVALMTIMAAATRDDEGRGRK